MWTDQHVLRTISGYFEDLDGNTRTYFLRKLETFQRFEPQILLDLIRHMDSLSQNQLKMLIRIFEKHEWGQEVMVAIIEKLNNSEMTYGYLVEVFLDEMRSGKN